MTGRERLQALWSEATQRLGQLVTLRRRVTADIEALEKQIDALDAAAKALDDATPKGPAPDTT